MLPFQAVDHEAEVSAQAKVPVGRHRSAAFELQAVALIDEGSEISDGVGRDEAHAYEAAGPRSSLRLHAAEERKERAHHQSHFHRTASHDHLRKE